jgi:hypothetical protein
MIGLRRFIRLELVFSVVGHGCLLLLLFYISASSVPPAPPEAMTVEIVPASEAPKADADQTDTNFEGTPLKSTSTGSEMSSSSEKGSATAERPRPKTAMPSLEQAQTNSKTPRKGSSAPAQPETQPQASEPLLPPTAQADQPQPHPSDAANASEMFAMPLAMPGGKLGGGFDAPASNAAMLPHDDTAAFRARLSLCSQLPPGIDENAAIALRISFKPDGTLASPPELLQAALSADAATLLNTAVNALERCQPFTELPPDKYKKWKTMRIIVTPLALSGG